MQFNWWVSWPPGAEELVVDFPHRSSREYTSWAIIKKGEGFYATLNSTRMAGPYDTREEARNYCEVCYRMGVHE